MITIVPIAATGLLCACKTEAGANSASAEGTSTGAGTSVTSAASAAPAVPGTTPADAPAGPVVVLDPGHNGGNASHPAEINRPVPDGRGGTKCCNTTGTAAADGYTEHEFNWDVANRVRDILSTKGFQVIMTRDSDTGVGPCVNERAAIGNRSAAAAVVSIHADGAPAGAHGFHVNYSSPALNAAQGDPSIGLATALRDAMVTAGFTPATYIGSQGLKPRSDLAGLNLSDRPTALVECGNMRQAEDIAVLESPDGRARIAATIARAVATYLGQ
jgi:N-acetylmuramoyl-L-alanine amidase